MQNLSFVHLSALQMRAVSRKMAETSREPSYPFPWESLEQDLVGRGFSRLPLVVYGSLLYSGSATQTWRDKSASRRHPVLGFGVRRIFNYDLPLGSRRYPVPTQLLVVQR